MQAIVRHQKYIIRSYHAEDAPSLAKHANNRKVWLNLRDRFPHPYRLQDAVIFLEAAVRSDQVYAIAKENECIGGIGIHPDDDVHRHSAELGYWLAEPFWGQGIMSALVSPFCTFAADAFNLHRIYAEPYTTNPASARVLEKSGFQLEGTMRKNVFKDGVLMDQWLYAKLFI